MLELDDVVEAITEPKMNEKLTRKMSDEGR